MQSQIFVVVTTDKDILPFIGLGNKILTKEDLWLKPQFLIAGDKLAYGAIVEKVEIKYAEVHNENN